MLLGLRLNTGVLYSSIYFFFYTCGAVRIRLLFLYIPILTSIVDLYQMQHKETEAAQQGGEKKKKEGDKS